MAITHGPAEDSLTQSEGMCSHDLEAENAAIAWPGDSCDSDADILSTLSTSTPYPISCPPNRQNTKCFPIWEESSSSTPAHWDSIFAPSSTPSSSPSLELRSLHDEPPARIGRRETYPTLPETEEQAPLPSPQQLGYQARSVTLRWPDGMSHAIFYLDAGCQIIEGDDLEGERWHVEREGTTRREQCFTLPKGRAGEAMTEEVVRWASVEFMREDEWRVWSRRRRGLEDGVGWGWRGLL